MNLFDRFKKLLAGPVLLAGFCVIVGGCGGSAAMNQSTANVKHIAQGEFTNEVTQSALPVVVDFYATWCGPCRELSPMLDRVAANYTGKIKFLKANVDECHGLAQDYNIEQIPLVLFFRNGKVVDRMLGVPTEEDLKAKLDALAKPNP